MRSSGAASTRGDVKGNAKAESGIDRLGAGPLSQSANPTASTQSGPQSKDSGSGGKRADDQLESESPTYRARRTRVSVAAPSASDEAMAEPEAGVEGAGLATSAPEKSSERQMREGE